MPGVISRGVRAPIIREGDDIVKLVAACVEKAMAEALQSDVPVWIHCCIDKDEKVLPMIPGGCTCDSIIME